MKFAQFQSTYKPLPIQTYEQTGRELETKYFNNKQQASLFRQGMSNTKVEDRNLGILAKTTSDVEGMLNEVNNNWQYAGNILFNAKDRIVNDKALNASMEDYAKSQAAKTEQQKRMEEGKIDESALSAFYINDKRYNDKQIQVDSTGIIKNRWNTPTPVNKVDTQKKVLEIVDLLTKHKDSLGVSKAGDGSVLGTIYQNNPNLEGYVTKTTRSGKDPELIAKAVKEWINTTPEIKEYYNYINDANVFNMVTKKDANGKYLKDENNNFIQEDITPSDFRELGIQVSDDWTSLKNTIITPNKKNNNTTLETFPIQGLALDFKQSSIYKQYKESGMSDKQVLQQMYKQTLTDLQTDKIVNFSRTFGYSELNTEEILNKRYWLDEERNAKFREKNGLYGAVVGLSPMYNNPSFSINANTLHMQQLAKDAKGINQNTPDGKIQYARLQNEIDDLKQTENVLRNSYVTTNSAGATVINELVKDFLDVIPEKDQNLFKSTENYNKLVKYITGQSDELGIDYNINNIISSTIKPGAFILNRGDETFSSQPNARPTVSTKFNNLRTTFNSSLEKAVQNNEINVSFPTTSFTDQNMEIAPLMQNIATNIIQRGGSWNVIGGKQGEPMILNDLYNKEGIDPSKYTAYAELPDTNNAYGKIVIRFVPNGKDPKTPILKHDKYVIEPNIENKDDYFQEIAQLAGKTSMSPQVSSWASNTLKQSLLHKYFEPIKTALSIIQRNSPTADYRDLGERHMWNVPISLEKGLTGNFVIDSSTGKPSLWQADENGNKIKEVFIGTSIDQIEDYIAKEITK